MKHMKDIPEIDRPLNKAISKGPRVLSDQELIEALLVTGNEDRDIREIARDVNRALSERVPTYEELKSIAGMSPEKAVQVLSCFEIGRRHYATKDVQKVTRPEDCLNELQYIRDKKQEHFVVLSLNGAGEILGNRIITVGLLNHSLVHPREVFADAITDRAASIICAHNHPSNSLEPSSQDIAITTQLKEAGNILGISLIDHLIVTKTGFVSMRERGLI